MAVGIVLSELRDKIRERLRQARLLAWTIKPAVMPAFLHVALTQSYLAKLDERRNAVMKSGAEIAQWRKQWALWKAAKSESF
jgi:phytoene synthase